MLGALYQPNLYQHLQAQHSGYQPISVADLAARVSRIEQRVFAPPAPAKQKMCFDEREI